MSAIDEPAVREQIRHLVSATGGLLCVHNTTKANLIGCLEHLNDRELSRFLEDGLYILQAFVEPLAHDDKSPFWEICQKTANVDNLPEIAAVLGIAVPKEANEHPVICWMRLLEERHKQPAVSLYCAANAWLLSFAYLQHDESILSFLTQTTHAMALSLSNLGRNEQALAFLESSLLLKREDYERDLAALTTALKASPLARLEDPVLYTMVLDALCVAVERSPDRGEQHRVLLERAGRAALPRLRYEDPAWPIHNTVNLLLHPVMGLRCITRFQRVQLLTSYYERKDERVARKLERVLRLLEQFIEPIARNPEGPAETRFAELCEALLDCSEPVILARELGLEVPTPSNHALWGAWCKQATLPEVRLYCLTNVWASAHMHGATGDDQAPLIDEIASLAMQITKGLVELGLPRRAAAALVNWLELTPAHFQGDAPGLGEALRLSPLGASTDPRTWGHVYAVFSGLLKHVPGLGDDPLTAVGQAWRVLMPDVCYDDSRYDAEFIFALPMLDDIGFYCLASHYKYSLRQMIDEMLAQFGDQSVRDYLMTRLNFVKEVIEPLADPERGHQGFSSLCKKLSRRMSVHESLQEVLQALEVTVPKAGSPPIIWLRWATELEERNPLGALFCLASWWATPRNCMGRDIDEQDVAPFDLTDRVLNRMGAQEARERLVTYRKKPEQIHQGTRASCLHDETLYAYNEAIQEEKGEDALSDVWLVRYFSERILIVLRLVDQLARPPQEGGHPTFHDLCCALGATRTLPEAACVLGVTPPTGEYLWNTWSNWCRQVSDDPVRRLYCSANAWLAPVFAEDHTQETQEQVRQWEVRMFTSLTSALTELGHPELTEQAWKAWLRVATAEDKIPEAGLLCVPDVSRKLLDQFLRTQPLTSRLAYKAQRIRYLELHFEPLTRHKALGGNNQFAAVCNGLRQVETLEALTGKLGVPIETDLKGLTLEKWLLWGIRSQDDAARWLYCNLNAWLFLLAIPEDADVDRCNEGLVLELIGQACNVLGRPSVGVTAIEDWMGISKEVYESPDDLGLVLTSRPFAELRDAKTQMHVLRVLAGGLRETDHRGERYAVRLLETWMNVSEEAYRTRTTLSAALDRSPLSRINKPDQVGVITELMSALGCLPERGPRHVITLGEVWLNLPLEAYGDRKCLSNTLKCSALGQVDNPIGAAQFLSVLGDALRAAPLVRIGDHGGPRYAVSLIEAWLELRGEHYESRRQLRRSLRRSPLRKVRLSVPWGKLLGALASALKFAPGRGPNHAARLLEAWLKLSPGKYRSRALLAGHLRQSPLKDVNAGAMNQASIVSDLASALRLSSKRRARDAVTLVEAWLDVPVHRFAEASVFEDLDYIGRVQVVLPWIEAVPPDHPELMLTCESVIRLICNARAQLSLSFQQRVDMVESVRETVRLVQHVALRRAAILRKASKVREVRAVERRVLEWAEAFENYLLTERMLQESDDTNGESPGSEQTWVPGTWPFRQGWPTVELDSWGPEGVARWNRRLNQQGADSSVSSHCCSCLRDEPAADRPVVRKGKMPKNRMAREERRKMLEDLADPRAQRLPLIPEGSVWVRCLFGRRGRLHWWAWHKQDGEVALLTCGRSEAFTEQRLELANLLFDLRVERIWASYEGARLDAFDRQYAEQLTCLASNAKFRSEKLRSREEWLRFWGKSLDVMDNLGQLKMAWLQQVGMVLLDFVLSFWKDSGGLADHLIDKHPGGTSLSEWALKEWRAGLAVLREGWGEPFGSWVRDERLRRELNLASEAHLGALKAELDLSRLAVAGKGRRIGWDDTDVLFQVQGPLLAAPLCWIDFGDQRLFEKVASVSSVPSLTLRSVAEKEAGKKAEESPDNWPSREVLSVLWEHPDRRSASAGLPLLHSALQRIAQNHGWQSWALADDPPARVSWLRWALAMKRFGIVVVGAHGLLHHAGVKLADDETWGGDGADLSEVDLLILVACAVGRLKQRGGRDVEGLYSELVANRGRTVIAARWPIADVEAACLAAEIVSQYVSELQRKGKVETFDRARALNRARRKALQEGLITFHLAAAFDIYGLG